MAQKQRQKWFFTDFTVIFSLPQPQIQLAALEENPGHSN
jgi:hypothetical protein